MSAPIKNFTLDQGSGFERQLTWRDARKQPVRLTDWLVEMLILRDGSDEPLLTLTPENGGIVLDRPAGKIKFRLSDAQTSALNHDSVRYVLNVQAPGQFPQRLLRGRMTIVRD